MARTKASKGKRAVEASSSGHVQRKEKRKKAAEDSPGSKERKKWMETINNRTAKNERYVTIDSSEPAMLVFREAMRRQGLGYWCRDKNPGFNLALVKEFYKNMVLPGDFRADGAKIVSRIGRVGIEIDVDKIAAYLHYERPGGELNYPRPVGEPIDNTWVVEHLYNRASDWPGAGHRPGKFRPIYRLANQLVCHNLMPRATENEPSREAGDLIVKFMEEDTRCDWALFIFGQMVAFRRMNKNVRMPYPVLISRIAWTENEEGNLGLSSQYLSVNELEPKEINNNILQRSLSQTHGRQAQRLTTSLTEAPPRGSRLSAWIKKVFCQNVATIESRRKQKRREYERDRREEEHRARVEHIVRVQGGENLGPYVPRDWPELVVSDDYADVVEEEGEEEVGNEGGEDVDDEIVEEEEEDEDGDSNDEEEDGSDNEEEESE